MLTSLSCLALPLPCFIHFVFTTPVFFFFFVVVLQQGGKGRKYTTSLCSLQIEKKKKER